MQQVDTNLQPDHPAATHLVSSEVVAILLQQLGDLLHVDSVIERCGITNLPFVGCHLALQALDQVTNCHTGGDGVWVDDDVRGDAFTGERHVLWTGYSHVVSTGKDI